MNEIVPESPEKESDVDDENAFIPETPQKNGSPQICKQIPIPSLNRIRKLLGVLDNNTGVFDNNTNILSPKSRRHTEKRPTSASKTFPRSKNYRKDKFLSLQKIKVSLFHDKRKENKPKKESFSVNAKSFYGSTNNKVPDHYSLAPEAVKSVSKQSSRKKRSPPASYTSIHKQLIKKHKKGEINCGVGHGIKKPKRKRSSLKNDSMEDKKQNESLTEKQSQSLTEKQNDSVIGKQNKSITKEQNKVKENINHQTEIVQMYDSTKKFFKHKQGTGSNITSIKPVKSSTPVPTTTKSYKKDFSNCEHINKEPCLMNVNEVPVTPVIEDARNKNVINENLSSSKGNLESQETTELLISQKDIDDWNRLSEDVNYNPIETIDRNIAPTNQNDVQDLLRILEEDWMDDTVSEETTFDKANTFYLQEPSDIFKDVVVTSAIESIFNNAIINSESLINPSTYIPVNLENNKEVTEQTGDKYYPLFYKGASSHVVSVEASSKKQNQNIRKLKYDSDEKQYQIDAGQKVFGAIQCKECNLIYHVGDKDDEKAHLNYHNSFQTLKFQGWKNECVVFEDPLTKSRVILIEPSDSSLHRKKVMEVLEVVDRDLGFSEAELSNYKENKIYFYVKDKTILGVLVAEYVNTAFRMIPELIDLNCCSSENSPVKCGINVVWTTKSHRRQGVATKLVDVLRTNYVYGYIMSVDDIAFSIPTPSGKVFAEKYTKTRNFKVY